MEQHLAQLIPLSIKYRQEAGEGDDELQEACLQVTLDLAIGALMLSSCQPAHQYNVQSSFPCFAT